MNATIRPIKVSKILELRKMFKRALYEDFSYFPGEYIDSVSRDNTLWDFLRAGFNSKRVVLGLFEDNQLIGYAIADTTITTDSDIFWFYIIPERRGLGLGKKFFTELLKELENRGVSHVYLMTHNQRGFYERFKFRLLSKNSQLFEGITMYEMVKDIG